MQKNRKIVIGDQTSEKVLNLRKETGADGFSPTLKTGTDIPEFIWKQYETVIDAREKVFENDLLETIEKGVVVSVNMASHCHARGKKYICLLGESPITHLLVSTFTKHFPTAEVKEKI